MNRRQKFFDPKTTERSCSKQREVNLPIALELLSVRGLDDLMNRSRNFTKPQSIDERIGRIRSTPIAQIRPVFEHFFALSLGKKLRLFITK